MNGIAWYTLEGDSKICDYKIRRNVMSIITIYIETLNHNFDFNKVISRNLENLLSQARIDCQIKGWTMPRSCHLVGVHLRRMTARMTAVLLLLVTLVPGILSLCLHNQEPLEQNIKRAGRGRRSVQL